MTTLDCKSCQEMLPELLLDGNATYGAAEEHLSHCTECRAKLQELRATLALMDEWTAPEPSAYFDPRLYARLREEPEQATAGAWRRVRGFFGLGGERGLRPALVGALGLVMMLGGGTAATVLLHHGHAPAVASPTVDDLKIYDNNAQAVQQMDILDETGQAADDPPQT